jgi:UDP-N-acetyl-2-amino-2-deoxyglucuronate dehydrogenase
MHPPGSAVFGIVGVAGYVAPRHLEAMHATGGRLVLACDKSDSVGVLDRFSLDTEFTTDARSFAKRLRQLCERHVGRAPLVAICTPNHLHLDHCRLVLEAGADAICEKPLVLALAELEALRALERASGRRVHTLLQLRMHDRVVALKRELGVGARAKHDVVLTYVVGRGPWYHASWKGDAGRSGGVATNIGVHLFDLLIWLFGEVVEARVHLSDARRMSGRLELERASVRWFVSVDSADAAVAGSGRVTRREIVVDGKSHEFSDGFAALHTRVYEAILGGSGLGLDDARPSVELTERLRSLPLSPVEGDGHPLCGAR